MNSPSQQDPWIGRLIGDRQRYRVLQRIDSGGMGYVLLAMDTLLGQQVALKLLKETLVGSEELIKRFEREVALCAALKSDHIVEVSDYGVTAEGHPFYIMEYLRGQSLGRMLRREQRLPIKRTVDIISQVCDGLQLAHQGVTLWRHGATASEHVKVVHRDLKPDNIFLVPTTLGELVKILDFGIARKIRDDPAEQTNLTNTFLGTFRYAAPEQLGVAKNLDGRADIYSLGIILYEMLSGADPFGFGGKARTTTGLSWAVAHTSKPPQPLRLQVGCEQVSVELEAVVMRCIEKAPPNRFASVEELNQALRAAVKPELSGTNMPPQPLEQGVPDATIAQILLPTTEKSSTVNRPLAASGQEVVDGTIVQSPRASADNPTVPRRRSPAEQGVPDATIAQIPLPTPEESSTVNRPLAASGQEVADGTIVQSPRASADNPTVPGRRIPVSQEVADGTIVQSPRASADNPTVPGRRTPIKQEVPDATTAQTPPAKQSDRNTTIIQQRTPIKQRVPDITTAQTPSRHDVFDATIAQSRIAPGQKNHRFPTHLLPLGIGIAIGLVAMGAILAYMQLQPRQTVVDALQILKTQAKYEECITEAEAVTQDSQLYSSAQTLLNECLMAYAKKLATDKNFDSAVALAREIPEDSSLHSEAQALINQWTKQIDKSV